MSSVLLDWFIAGGLLAIFAMIWTANKENSDRVSRVYSRLDEYKESVENKYVQRNVCEVLHKQIKDDVSEIKADIKILLRKANGKE